MTCGFSEAENKQGPEDSRRAFDLSLNCLKNANRGPEPGRQPSPKVTTAETKQADRKEPSKVC